MVCGPELHDYWTTAIDVEMHFNEMLASTRGLVSSVMLAVFGAAIAATIQLKNERIARVFGIPIGALILLGGLVFLGATFLLDYCYYYPLLLGSVDVAEKIENQCKSVPGLTLELSRRVPLEVATNVLNAFYVIVAFATLGAIPIIWVWDCALAKERRGRPSASTAKVS